MKKFRPFSLLKEYRRIIVPAFAVIIPCTIFLIVLITASINSNSVVIGKRYRNDLNPKITNDDISTVYSQITSISGVDSAEVNLKTSQLRILIDANDSITTEDADRIAKEAYNRVNTVLSIVTYFTRNNQGEKMYDLEITVYNDISKNDGLIIYSLVKNSKMDEYQTSISSEAKDEDLVKSILLKEEEKNSVTSSPETTPQFTEELEDEDSIQSE